MQDEKSSVVVNPAHYDRRRMRMQFSHIRSSYLNSNKIGDYQ